MAKKQTKKEISEEELKGESLVNQIIKERDYYLASSRGRRQTWVECWKMYMSFIDTTKNPFLANLFIPKTHEAVELLAAFLSGPNQSITATAEGKGDTKKAVFGEKLLEFQWRKVLKARTKILTWIKQAILFCNGIMKAGWDEENNKPFMEPISLPDIYFDYYHKDIQESPSVIHRIVKKVEKVKEDERYNQNRNQVIPVSEFLKEEKETRFSAYDETILMTSSDDETELLERWTLERIVTIAPTGSGYKILRNVENDYKDSDGNPFMPFVKVRMKVNPLPNRAYDIGMVEPTIKIQKAFNDMMNEVFDNVSLINNKMWIKKRTANINPMDLVRRPGGVITVENDINTDIKAEEIGDIKTSALEMLKILDNEFQQSSMVVNLLKGIPGAEFATEAALGQQNVMTLLEPVDQNIKEALSELGQMILEIDLDHINELQSVKVFDSDKEEVWAEFNVKEIAGKYDVQVSADRSGLISKAVRQKQLLDFLAIVSKDETTLAKYPDLTTKIYKKWLQNAGEGDIDYYFEESQPTAPEGGAPPMPPIEQLMAGLPPTYRVPARGQQLTEKAIEKSTMAPLVKPPIKV